MPSSVVVTDVPERGITPGLSWFRLPTASGGVRLMLVGQLDLATADCAREVVRRAQGETDELSCDLGDVWFVDFAGLRVLIDAAARARGRLRLVNCPPIVPRMLRLLGLEDAVEIRATRP